MKTDGGILTKKHGFRVKKTRRNICIKIWLVTLNATYNKFYTHTFLPSITHSVVCEDMYIINKNGTFFWFSSKPPQNSGKRDKREYYLKVFPCTQVV